MTIIIYTVSGKVTTQNEIEKPASDAYNHACDWFLSNVDKNVHAVS